VHPLFPQANKLGKVVIGAAIEVHRLKGAGLIESIYERRMMRELELLGVPCVNQKLIPVEHKGVYFDEPGLQKGTRAAKGGEEEVLP
jgi:GxxExxY protein